MSASILSCKTLLSELEAALQKSLDITSKFGSGCSLVDLGDGKGIASIVGLLTADWTPANDALPKTFAVKISSADAKPIADDNQLAALAAETEFDDKQQRTADYHNRESLIFERFNAHNVKDAKVPKVYATKKRPSVKDIGFIIMEHVPGCASLHMNNNLPYDAVVQVVKAVASFHVQSSLFSNEEQKNMKGQAFGTTFNILFEPNMMTGLKKMIKDFGGEMMKDEAEEMATVIDEMAQKEYLEFVDNTSELLGAPRLLCHADVWMCNMLWKKSEDVFNLEALIDLQTAQFTCPAIDLIRLYTGCCSGKQRLEQWEEFTKLYWDIMNEHYNGNPPYTYAQMIEGYKRMFPAAAYVVAASIGAVGQMIIDKQDGDESKKQARENLMEKQVHLLRDIIKYHKRNIALIQEQK